MPRPRIFNDLLTQTYKNVLKSKFIAVLNLAIFVSPWCNISRYMLKTHFFLFYIFILDRNCPPKGLKIALYDVFYVITWLRQVGNSESRNYVCVLHGLCWQDNESLCAWGRQPVKWLIRSDSNGMCFSEEPMCGEERRLCALMSQWCRSCCVQLSPRLHAGPGPEELWR